jgi:hypothetical protein
MCQVGHADQRVGILVPEYPLSRLYHLHLQLFGLPPPPLIAVHRRQVGRFNTASVLVDFRGGGRPLPFIRTDTARTLQDSRKAIILGVYEARALADRAWRPKRPI